MNKNLRNRILSISLLAAMTLTLTSPTNAALVKKNMEVTSGVNLYVNDTLVKPVDAKGKAVDVFTSEGTTYVPVRAVAGATGNTVASNGAYQAVYLADNTADAKDAEYLKAFFGIEPFSGTVTRAAFDAALAKLKADKTTGTGKLTIEEAVKSAVIVAGMEPLALTYTAKPNPKKAAERLAAYGVRGVSESNAPYVAAALDCSMAFAGWRFGNNLDAATATTLLANAVEVSGQGRNYLGSSNDADIYAKLQSAWATFGNFDDAKLSKLGADLVISGASTGYNLKYDGYNANFLPAYTLQYGHSDIEHAVQLIALLNSEGIDAKVALEPKTSVYEYLVEWGDPKNLTMTETYEVKEIDGNRFLCYATEYDMKLEFDTIAEKNAFDSVIGKYAKKCDSNTNKDGDPIVPLISGAWWQPLYTSTVPMKDSQNFVRIKDNVVRNGAYTIHPFSTVDGTAKISKVVAQKAPDLKTAPTNLYVNKAFYNYLTGADHQ